MHHCSFPAAVATQRGGCRHTCSLSWSVAIFRLEQSSLPTWFSWMGSCLPSRCFCATWNPPPLSYAAISILRVRSGGNDDRATWQGPIVCSPLRSVAQIAPKPSLDELRSLSTVDRNEPRRQAGRAGRPLHPTPQKALDGGNLPGLVPVAVRVSRRMGSVRKEGLRSPRARRGGLPRRIERMRTTLVVEQPRNNTHTRGNHMSNANDACKDRTASRCEET